jgi:hypothetical protein
MRPLRCLTHVLVVTLAAWSCAITYDAFLGAVPTDGEAPLLVTFSVSHTAPTNNRCRLDFGDNTEELFGEADLAGCSQSFEATHTYATPGEYDVILEVFSPSFEGPDAEIATASLVVTVRAGNTAPQAADDQGATTRGVPVTVNVLANDVDADGDTLTITTVTVATADTAIVATNNGDGTLTVNPGPDFVGTIDVDYTADDGRGGQATATLAVTVAPSPGTGMVGVNVVDPSGQPQAATAVASQIGSENWEQWGETQPGTGLYQREIVGDEPVAWTVLCSREIGVQTDHLIQTFIFRPSDTDKVTATCPFLSATERDLVFAYKDLNTLGVGGSYRASLYDWQGLSNSADGLSGNLNALRIPALLHDFIVVGSVDGVLAGAEVFRDIVPNTGDTLDAAFTPANVGGTKQINPFTVPSGYSGLFATWWATKGGAILPTGEGTDAGGSYFTVPDAVWLEGDLYSGTAIGSTAESEVTHSLVFAKPTDLTYTLPDPSALTAPVPSPTPTLDFSGARAGATAYEVTLQRFNAPNFFSNFVWLTLITPAALDAGNTYQIVDLSTVPGFAAYFALETGDQVAWKFGEVISNLPFSQIVRSLRKAGLPLNDGLSLERAAKLGGYVVP